MNIILSTWTPQQRVSTTAANSRLQLPAWLPTWSPTSQHVSCRTSVGPPGCHESSMKMPSMCGPVGPVSAVQSGTLPRLLSQAPTCSRTSSGGILLVSYGLHTLGATQEATAASKYRKPSIPLYPPHVTNKRRHPQHEGPVRVVVVVVSTCCRCPRCRRCRHRGATPSGSRCGGRRCTLACKAGVQRLRRAPSACDGLANL